MGMILYRRRRNELKHTTTAERQMEKRAEKTAEKRLNELGHKKGKKGRRSKAELAEQQQLAKVVNGSD